MSVFKSADRADAANAKDEVKDYYSKVLKKSDDLKTNACCTSENIPKYIKTILGTLHEDTLTKYYGCGIVIPGDLEGLTVLDLGCGVGRDVYVISKLVGPKGKVIGIDMTEEQLKWANMHKDFHAKAFGHAESNVEFIQGYIEKLPLADNSVDIIVSNCVVNLSPDKHAVLSEAYRVLKPGGEMYFSDVYSSRRIPQALREDSVLFGECLSGALYWNDFVRLAQKVGFLDPRLVKDAEITIDNKALEEKIGYIDFYSATYRLWKLPELEPDCEDYGQAVVYKGTVTTEERTFILDDHHKIEKGRVFPVCGNTNMMLQATRFAKHFEFIGDTSVHYGIYADCGRDLPFASAAKEGGGGACC